MVGVDKIIGVDLNSDKVEMVCKFGMIDFVNLLELGD